MADTGSFPAISDDGPDPVDAAAYALADATRELKGAAAWLEAAGDSGDPQVRALIADRLACGLEGLAFAVTKLEAARAWRALRSPFPARKGRHAGGRHLKVVPPA